MLKFQICFASQTTLPASFYIPHYNKMIGLKGTLNVIDNSGAIIAECIRVMSGARFARAGKE
jgi:hypothetical protein